MTTINDEWASYILTQETCNISQLLSQENLKTQTVYKRKLNESNESDELFEPNETMIMPKCDDLYISTKTKVLFLNQSIDINTIFWKIHVIEYWKPETGVVKKQMKIVSKTPEDFIEYTEKKKDIPYYSEHIIKQINNPNARRIKFKDERKITIGISKKDIMNCRGKVKNAFYNCFALILRFKYEDTFKEIHVKIFNTGKLEIPGILNNNLLDIVKQLVLDLITPYCAVLIDFINNDNQDNVLINSNFSCNYYINREQLFIILKNEYHVKCSYDPCSYPGIQCKYKLKNGMEISFMIFRTGSVLIVGKCENEDLYLIYDFIK